MDLQPPLPTFAGKPASEARPCISRQDFHRHSGFGRARNYVDILHPCFIRGGVLLLARHHGRTRLRQQMPQQCKQLLADSPDFASYQKRKQAAPKHFVLSQAKSLHPEQERATDEIFHKFKESPKVTLRGVTGSGKTFVACQVINRLQPKLVLVMSPSKVLAKQLQRNFGDMFENSSSHIFVSDSRGYSASEIALQGGKIEVKKGRRIQDEDLHRARRQAVCAVNKGESCIITCSIASIFGCGPLIMHVEDPDTDGWLTETEKNSMVNQLEMERKRLETELENIKISGGQSLSKRAWANRIEDDIRDLKETGTCQDIYALYYDLLPDRATRTLIDKIRETYGSEWLMIIDECHSTVPAMKSPHKARLTKVRQDVARGFLRNALLSRPGLLSWKEISEEYFPNWVLSMSATPPNEDLGPTVDLEMRPTHICDPVITSMWTQQNPKAERGRSQHDFWSLLTKVLSILSGRKPEEQAIVATIECNQADVLQAFINVDHRCGVVHGNQASEEREEVLKLFREGKLDVLCGSKMLIEGLDLPGVAMVLVADANAPGFLRTEHVLTQLVGRAARHACGRAFFLLTEAPENMASVNKCIQEHGERRARQEAYNIQHRKKPESIEWAPRLERTSKAEKVDGTSSAPTLDILSAEDNSVDPPTFTREQCLRIFSELVRNCWAEKPAKPEELDSEELKWTAPIGVCKEKKHFEFQLPEVALTPEEKKKIIDLMREQLVLMVTVPMIGPERSYQLLGDFDNIDNIISQERKDLKKVVQIRHVLSKRLLSPTFRHFLTNNRRKLKQILQLKEFVSQVSDLFPKDQRVTRKEVKCAIDLEIEHEADFVSEVVLRLIKLCNVENERQAEG